MLASTNKVNDIIRETTLQLTEVYGTPEAASIIRCLLQDRYGITRVSLALHPDMVFNESQIVQIYADMKKLLQGMPVQYVTGTASFMGFSLKVNPWVLIPRQETEELVLAAIHEAHFEKKTSLLEIGTGSGAIAIAVKLELPNMVVIATDVCRNALDTAMGNASDHNCDISFFLHNILVDPPMPGINPDIIVSNPPYIPRSETIEMMKNVTDFEPYLALFVDDENPLLFYKHIAAFGKKTLTPDGILLLEVHHPLANQVAECLESLSYQHVTVMKDINGLNRIVKATCL